MANGHGGKRPGSGRKKGSANRKTREVADRAAAAGVTPLEVLLEAMTYYHGQGDRQKAAAMAKEAAPYCHPRLSAVALSGGEKPVQLELVEEVIDAPCRPSANGEAARDPAGVPPE